MAASSKGIAPGFLTYIIVIVLIVLVIFMVFTFVVSKFGGGSFCQTRFEGEVNKLVQEAATTYGSSAVYTSFKVENCVKDVYYVQGKGVCYTYTDDVAGTKDCQKPVKAVYFQYETDLTTPIDVGFVNCGTITDVLNAGYYTVKVTAKTVTCQR